MSLLSAPIRAALRRRLLASLDRLYTAIDDHLADLPDQGGQQSDREAAAALTAEWTRAA